MQPLKALTTLLHRVWGPRGTHGPTKVPECHKPADHNFRTMKLLKRRLTVDAQGRWWKEETRHCQYTGIIIKETRRITD
jgi:hypothetical protein